MGCVSLPPIRHLQAHLQQTAMSCLGYGKRKWKEVGMSIEGGLLSGPLSNPLRSLFSPAKLGGYYRVGCLRADNLDIACWQQ